MAKRKRTAANDGHITLIALMRGINVGGRHMLPMATLRTFFEKAGCANVRTYIQSGNVVFEAPSHFVDSADAKLGTVIGGMIHKRFGFEPAIILRTHKQLQRIIKAHPFAAGEANHKALHIGFLNVRPTAAQIAALDPRRSPGDRFEVRDREIHLHTPNGLGQTKFTNAYFDSILKTPSTFRNWRTVLTLEEMAQATNAG